MLTIPVRSDSELCAIIFFLFFYIGAFKERHSLVTRSQRANGTTKKFLSAAFRTSWKEYRGYENVKKLDPIILDKVSHAYAGSLQNSLSDISVSFPLNKITAVVGTSGSGKSTLLQLINGLLRPTHGNVLIFGQPIPYAQRSLRTIRHDIGYVVQGLGLFPHLTVEENITLSAKINSKKIATSTERTDVLMDMMNLPLAYKKRYPAQLSGGEQQRVGLCRALYNSPRVLLMDESLGALDVITRKEIQLQILGLHQRESQTIVFVTHDIREAIRMGDRILMLHHGKVQQYDTKEAVLNFPANEFVASMIQP